MRDREKNGKNFLGGVNPADPADENNIYFFKTFYSNTNSPLKHKHCIQTHKPF